MAKEVAESEWDGTRFPREKNTGIVLGLDLAQVIVVLLGVGFSVALVFAFGFPLGFLACLVGLIFTAALALPRFWGRSLLAWIGVTLLLYIRGSKGQTRFRRKPKAVTTYADRAEAAEIAALLDDDQEQHGDYQVEISAEDVPGGRDKFDRIVPGPGWRFNLPGEAEELRCYVLPGGGGFVFDPRRKEGMVVAQLATEKAFALESWESMEDRTRAYRDAITAICGIKGVSRIQMSDQTTLVSGSLVEEYYHEKRAEAPKVLDRETGEKVPLSGENVEPFQHASYLDLLASAQDQPVHELWLTVVLDATKLERRALSAGGGLRGFMEVSLGVMANIEAIVPESGVTVAGWHTPRSVAALSRTAFDPDSTLKIADRQAEHSGVAPEEAGPMSLDEHPNHVTSDGWMHRTYMISEWPQAQAQLGFLDRLIFAGAFRHTVTVTMRPKDLRGALRKTTNRKGDWQTADNIRRKLDRPESLEHQREREDIDKEESELMLGHAPVDVVCLVTVSGADEAELESNCGDLQAKAAQANCELRPMFSQQGSSFIAGALPFAWAVFDK